MLEESEVMTVRKEAIPLHSPASADAIVADVGEATIVMLGEATHGTQEFYALRAAITKQLVTEKGFDAVAVEADWPDALQVHRHVQGEAAEGDAVAALAGFERFPRWMWRNTEILALVDWLREHNAGLAPADRVGFFGLDLYSLQRSMQEVVGYLQRHDPAAARLVRENYRCFDGGPVDPQRYGYEVTLGRRGDCAREATQALDEVLAARRPTGGSEAEQAFFAAQHARVVQGADMNPGTCATRTWPTRWTHCGNISARSAAARRSSWCGRTTRTSATRAPPGPARAARSASASWRASGMACTRCICSA